MDRPTIRREADARTATEGPAPDFSPASRRDLVALGQAALGAGPVLVTGDAGVGKSWLVGRWAGAVASCRWIRVDLTPEDPPSFLHRQLALALGLAPDPAAPPTRCDLAEALAERSLDGERFGLIVDEAHNLGAVLWEEVRVLLNRLGRDDGFAHLILVGQTPLVRRFAARTLGSIEVRLAAHLHLRPLDLADTRAWLAEADPARPWGEAEVEAIHRDSGGNPARLRRRLIGLALQGRTPAPAVAPAPPAPAMPPLADATPAMPAPATPAIAPPLTGPARPPLHVAEDSIEVGWSGDDAEEAPDPAPAPTTADDAPSEGVVRLDETEQAVHDHYAALQAWREWANNQARRPASAPAVPSRSDRELADEIDQAAEAEAADFFGESRPSRGAARTESHGSEPFAPFGSLFARLPRGVDAGPTRS